jgi:hypothetical protein
MDALEIRSAYPNRVKDGKNLQSENKEEEKDYFKK